MASRRSRLKAVANLPIRRKPLSVQQEVEGSKLQDEINVEPFFEAGDKEQEIGGCDETHNTEKLECSESVETVESSICVQSPVIEQSIQQEGEKDGIADVPSNENVCKPNQTNKSLPNPVPRFGRRVKPSVSLAVLKERTQRGEAHVEVSSKESESTLDTENHLNAQDIYNSNVLGSDFDKSVTNQKTGEESAVETVLNEAHNDSTAHTSFENVQTSIVTPDKSESEQCHLTKLGDQSQKTAERTLQLNLKSPVNSTKQSVCVNGMNISSKTTPDITLKQRNDVLSQSNRISSEHSPINSTSQNSFNFQFSSSSGRRPASSCVKQKKPKFNDFARKVADARREFQRKYEKIPPDRSSLRMIDLIFYNPSTNPMESKSKFEKKDLHINDQDLLNEDKVDDPDPVDKNSDSTPDDDVKNDDFGKMPVPQVKIGANGEIILDEKSLVIETTDAKKGREDLQNSVPVFEDRGSKTCYYKRKTQKSRDWSDVETKRFYKALNTIGTDFSLMQKYFPVRTRLELKNKFKREEKLNRNLIDRALNNPSEFDITQFEKYLAMEKQVQEEETERRLQRKIRPKRPENKIRAKSSLLAREITESDEEMSESQSSSVSDQAKMKFLDRTKKANEINLLCEKYSLRGSDKTPDGIGQEAVVVDLIDQSNGLNAGSKVFANPSITESENASKIRDAFDEIQNVNHSDANGSEGCGGSVASDAAAADVVDEFYQAVVSLSATLKSEACKNSKSTSNRFVKKAKPSTKGEKRKGSTQSGRKQSAKKARERPYMSTLDIETYDSKYDSNSSSNESNDNSFTSTKTITDQDFIKLLAANAQNMKESKIQFQITESCSLEKNVEIILDNVPSITLSEI